MLIAARIDTQLPDGFEALRAAAAAEGVLNMERLRADWLAGAARWQSGGAALFGVFAEAGLAGLGGVIRETAPGECAMRMHRFYVHPAYRRQGAGRRLAESAMAHALAQVSVLTCNAQASPMAAPFWERMGFARTDAEGYTHIFRAGTFRSA